MHIVDISSHQENINVSNLDCDAVIVKATDGIGYVNPYYADKARETVINGKLLGIYHFARDNNPVKECEYFMGYFMNYAGVAIPVLDWEQDQSVAWVNEWVRYLHDKLGVYPWIYGNPWRFNQGGVEHNCARWIASYPNVLNPGWSYDPGEPPETDGLVAAWQFCSDGRIGGYDGDLDLSVGYLDKSAWKKYASLTDNPAVSKPKKSVLENDDYKVTIQEK